MVKDLAELFQRLVGTSLSWFVLRDRDASIPKVLDHLRSDAQRRGIQHYHIWERYGIENYLLEPAIISAAVRTAAIQRNKPAPSDTEILECLDIACTRTFDSVRTDFVAATQNYYIKHELVSSNPRETAISDALAYLDGCRERDARLCVLPGYKVFGNFAAQMQERHGLALRFESLIEEMDGNNVPTELRHFFERLSSQRAG